MVGLGAFELVLSFLTRLVPVEDLMGSRPAPLDLDALAGTSGAVSLISPEGLVGAGLVHPVWVGLVVTVVASLAAGVMAADVEAGTAELVLSRAVSRTRLLLERVGALVVAVLGVTVAGGVGVLAGWALSPALREAVSLSGVVAATGAGAALALGLAGPAVVVSAAASRKAAVVSTSASVAVLGYVLNVVAGLWSPARWMARLTPFRYYRPADALVGVQVVGDALLLLGVFVLGVAVAGVLLHRRDAVL